MKNHLTITEAARICGYERSYFYRIIAKYCISIKKNNGKSYIDPAELCRALPADMINNELLAYHTRNNNIIPQETTPEPQQNNEVIELLKQQVKHLTEQLEISQKQVFSLLDTVNKQTLLLEYKPTPTNNIIPQETTPEYKALFDELRKKSKKKKKK
jgi:hypothetical protein